jgi:2-phosphoglycerate kinase
MKHAWIIVFTGLPGTGKTTLSKQVAGILDIPLIAKDAIKEIMYDTIGWSDKEFSGKLARATFGIIEYVIEENLRTGRSIIVESNYAPKLASKQFQQWQEQYGCTITQIVCRTDLDVLAQRYLDRIKSGQRHEGHIDNNGTFESYRADFERRIADEGEDQALAVSGDVKIVDTTDFSNVHSDTLAEWLEGHRPGTGV